MLKIETCKFIIFKCSYKFDCHLFSVNILICFVNNVILFLIAFMFVCIILIFQHFSLNFIVNNIDINVSKCANCNNCAILVD